MKTCCRSNDVTLVIVNSLSVSITHRVRCLDLGDSPLLSRCGETAHLDRYLKGAGNSCRRLLSFLQDLFSIWRSSATRLEQPRRERADHPPIGLVQSVGTRFPCCRRFHHLERLDTDAIDNATRPIGSSGVGCLVSRAVPAALSDVLGSPFGLSRFAFHGASRTGG